jgi:MraZ protein
MLNLIGVHDCKLDSKGRVSLPSSLRKQLLPVVEEGFVIKRSVFQKCLELYPIGEWNQIMGKVGQLNRFVKRNNDFIRLFSAGVKPLEMDGSGRFLIPRDLVLFAGLQTDLVLSASVNIIEVWDKQAYEQVLNEPGVDFGRLAEDVMGNLNAPGNDLP